ncbi:hypothetical protein Dimus_022323, partial [Dionaea muscipula]
VFEAFEVPLYDKEGDESVKTDFDEEILLNICQLRRENDIWWISIGANRRRDDEEEAASKEVNEGENQEKNFEWE